MRWKEAKASPAAFRSRLPDWATRSAGWRQHPGGVELNSNFVAGSEADAGAGTSTNDKVTGGIIG